MATPSTRGSDVDVDDHSRLSPQEEDDGIKDILDESHGRFAALQKDGNQLDSTKLRSGWEKRIKELRKMQNTIGEERKPLLVIWGVDVATDDEKQKLKHVIQDFLNKHRPKNLMLCGRRDHKFSESAFNVLEQVLGQKEGFKPSALISGGADGIDSLVLKLKQIEACPELTIFGYATPTKFARADVYCETTNPKPLATISPLAPAGSPLQYVDKMPVPPKEMLSPDAYGKAMYEFVALMEGQWEARDTFNADAADACIGFLTTERRDHDGTKAILNTFAYGRYVHIWKGEWEVDSSEQNQASNKCKLNTTAAFTSKGVVPLTKTVAYKTWPMAKVDVQTPAAHGASAIADPPSPAPTPRGERAAGMARFGNDTKDVMTEEQLRERLHELSKQGDATGLRNLLSDSSHSAKSAKMIKAVCPNLGRNLLHSASHHGSAECLQVLLERHHDDRDELADLLKSKTGENEKYKGATALYLATLGGHKDCVEILLNARVDVEVNGHHNIQGTPPLLKAVQFGHYDCAELLLTAKADPNVCNKDGDHSVIIAARYGEVDCLELVIERGGEIDQVNKKGQTAVFAATEKNRPYALDVLMKHGADLGTRTIELGVESPLQVATSNFFLACEARLTTALLQYSKLYPQAGDIKWLKDGIDEGALLSSWPYAFMRDPIRTVRWAAKIAQKLRTASIEVMSLDRQGGEGMQQMGEKIEEIIVALLKRLEVSELADVLSRRKVVAGESGHEGEDKRGRDSLLRVLIQTECTHVLANNFLRRVIQDKWRVVFPWDVRQFAAQYYLGQDDAGYCEEKNNPKTWKSYREHREEVAEQRKQFKKADAKEKESVKASLEKYKVQPGEPKKCSERKDKQPPVAMLWMQLASAAVGNFLLLLLASVYPPAEVAVEAAIEQEKEAARCDVKSRNPEPDDENMMHYEAHMYVDGALIKTYFNNDPESTKEEAKTKFQSELSEVAYDEAEVVCRHFPLFQPAAKFWTHTLSNLALAYLVSTFTLHGGDDVVWQSFLLLWCVQVAWAELEQMSAHFGVWKGDLLNVLELLAPVLLCVAFMADFVTFHGPLHLEDFGIEDFHMTGHNLRQLRGSGNAADKEHARLSHQRFGNVTESHSHVYETGIDDVFAAGLFLLWAAHTMRILQRIPALGTYVLMIGMMLGDVGYFFILITGPLVGFSAALISILGDERVEASDACDGLNQGLDAPFFLLKLFQVFLWLVQMMLGSVTTDTVHDCFKSSRDSPESLLIFLDAYLILVILLGLNMIIAMMATTFEMQRERQTTIHMFFTAIAAETWGSARAPPPPMQLLSYPFYALHSIMKVLVFIGGCTYVECNMRFGGTASETAQYTRLDSAPREHAKQAANVLQKFIDRCETWVVDKLKDVLAWLCSTSTKAKGLKWVDKGSQMPANSRLLVCNKLKEALGKTSKFTQPEWDEFDIKYLRSNHCVKVASGNYFVPEDPEEPKLAEHRNEVFARLADGFKNLKKTVTQTLDECFPQSATSREENGQAVSKTIVDQTKKTNRLELDIQERLPGKNPQEKMEYLIKAITDELDDEGNCSLAAQDKLWRLRFLKEQHATKKELFRRLDRLDHRLAQVTASGSDKRKPDGSGRRPDPFRTVSVMTSFGSRSPRSPRGASYSVNYP